MKRYTFLIMTVLSLLLSGQVWLERHCPLYEGALRFHVRAASNDRLEQELKLRVRDSLLEQIRSQTDRADSAGELEESLMEERTDIQRCAIDCLKAQGCERKVKVYFTKERFPIRRYGAIIFPAGVYSALRVDIGEAKGHNWWCALYPDLCYNDDDFILSGKGLKDLKEIFLGKGLKNNKKKGRKNGK